jgi:hypothetical protein
MTYKTKAEIANEDTMFANALGLRIVLARLTLKECRDLAKQRRALLFANMRGVPANRRMAAAKAKLDEILNFLDDDGIEVIAKDDAKNGWPIVVKIDSFEFKL